MKFIIALILSLAIVSAQTAGGYKDVDVSGLQANPTFMNVLDNAIGQIQGADGILAGGDWSVKKINSVQEQVVAGVNYKVDVTVESSDNAQKEVILTSSINPGPTPLRSPANKTPALVLSSVETLKLPVKPLTPNPTLNSKPPSTPVSPASKTTNSKVNSSLIAVWSMSKSKSLLVLTMTLSSLSLTATITARLLNASAISLPAASMVKSPLPPSTELNIW
eukprot:CAMPEP_0114575734 /NCGR_PEP_ID=MMETSP0125-20121206/567_1 /TAXON_ID=485358 ORGANISM="Aristerostoma sp., Strain ATCC 50986" /NCGR_SAMPLE_ID=MMETSP0125 /ASSEMBLY_ACC=CAM_ASM_000245 /LENGTH=220 /DNA_ID=CAMNT_0001763687 /DNA_START=17 /DNA_END=677 /DNA_ORIENTATION=-